MSLDLDRLISDVAARHQLVLRRDDPILATVALHEAILDQQAARIEAIIAELATHCDQASRQQVERSREIARTVVGEALTLAQQEIDKAADRAAARLDQAVIAHIDRLDKVMDKQGALRRSLWMGWSIAVAALIGLTFALVY